MEETEAATLLGKRVKVVGPRGGSDKIYQVIAASSPYRGTWKYMLDDPGMKLYSPEELEIQQ